MATRDRLLGMQLRQLEHMNRQIEAREMKSKHSATRVKWLERQKSANYRDEFNRLRGELSRSNVPDTTRQYLMNREAQLKKLIFT